MRSFYKGEKMKFKKEKMSPVGMFRKKYLDKGIHLVDVTQLCEFKLGRSGSCNGINEPDEEVYHIQVHYRGEPIANVHFNDIVALDDDMYCIFESKDFLGNDFIIFRKVICYERKKVKISGI